MLNEKKKTEELDESNQKELQKIAVKFLYYYVVIGPIMLLALNSLAVVHTKPTTETAKKITQFLNCSVSHPDTVIEYRRSGMILHIY